MASTDNQLDPFTVITNVSWKVHGGLLLFQMNQDSAGAGAQPVTVKGLPFAPGGFNVTPGAVSYVTATPAPAIVDKPSSGMVQKFYAWSPNYKSIVNSAPGTPYYLATSTLMLNPGLILSHFGSWDRTFSVTMPPVEGIKGHGGTVNKVIVWFYASNMLPAPTDPFDVRIETGPIANFTTGGWLAVLRDDQVQTQSMSSIFNGIKSALSGGTPISTPVQDGSVDPVTDGATLTALFSGASPPVPVPPPFNTYTFVASLVTSSTPVSDNPGLTFIAGGVFKDGTVNTYNTNFFSSEGFNWWDPATYGHLGTPTEAVQAPASVQLTVTNAVAPTASYTQGYRLSSDLKTLSKT